MVAPPKPNRLPSERLVPLAWDQRPGPAWPAAALALDDLGGRRQGPGGSFCKYLCACTKFRVLCSLASAICHGPLSYFHLPGSGACSHQLITPLCRLLQCSTGGAASSFLGQALSTWQRPCISFTLHARSFKCSRY
jgi:hypothetical protein